MEPLIRVLVLSVFPLAPHCVICIIETERGPSYCGTIACDTHDGVWVEDMRLFSHLAFRRVGRNSSLEIACEAEKGIYICGRIASSVRNLFAA